ncbi:MAG TPA: hypothetical protein VGD14_16890 [bacterium]
MGEHCDPEQFEIEKWQLLRFSVPKFPVAGFISFHQITGECSGDAPHYE